MAKKKTPKIAQDWNKRAVATGGKKIGLSKPKVANPMAGVGKAIGDKLVPAKQVKKPTKQQLMRDYSKSKYATKKGAMAAKRKDK